MSHVETVGVAGQRQRKVFLAESSDTATSRKDGKDSISHCHYKMPIGYTSSRKKIHRESMHQIMKTHLRIALP